VLEHSKPGSHGVQNAWPPSENVPFTHIELNDELDELGHCMPRGHVVHSGLLPSLKVPLTQRTCVAEVVDGHA